MRLFNISHLDIFQRFEGRHRRKILMIQLCGTASGADRQWCLNRHGRPNIQNLIHQHQLKLTSDLEPLHGGKLRGQLLAIRSGDQFSRVPEANLTFPAYGRRPSFGYGSI